MITNNAPEETGQGVRIDPVEDRLEDLLSKPEVLPGTRLPTERALAEDLKVSRSAVRRAMARLEAQGKVVRVIGSGTYVADAAPRETRSAGPVEIEDYSPREIMEARMLLEPRFASLIVMHANKADIEAVRRAFTESERAADFVTFEYWDGQFHQMLADATHNRLIIDLFRIITQSRDSAEWGELKKGSITAERRELYSQEHGRILDALQSRNARLAEKAIETHLVTVRQNLFGA
ncbi:FadR/GntR family transcriptional regulator [Sagittula salina]|uniref:FadR family transcriptional regulator n=1 Tax=Sagittula salina TaxID=2820268 RepID=A0A940S5A2_9RHOB|nr:FCD domain-containing protein [Sagittula salina]MBP0484939.1 FadR family transcriptional regulator [Sagittula salina]